MSRTTYQTRVGADGVLHLRLGEAEANRVVCVTIEPAAPEQISQAPAGDFCRSARESSANGAAWVVAAHRTVAQLAQLPNNWDSFGSPLIRAIAVQEAQRLLDSLAAQSLPPPDVCPVTGGGIDFTWRSQGRELGIEILPDGTAQYLTVEKDPSAGSEKVEEGALLLLPSEHTHALADWLVPK